jgi:hypothetical protein
VTDVNTIIQTATSKLTFCFNGPLQVAPKDGDRERIRHERGCRNITIITSLLLLLLLLLRRGSKNVYRLEGSQALVTSSFR